MTADGAAAVETLRAELARAKGQARISNADALKAAEEVKAEKATHGTPNMCSTITYHLTYLKACQ